MRDADAYECALILVRRVEGCPVQYAVDQHQEHQSAGRMVEARAWGKIKYAVQHAMALPEVRRVIA